MRSLVLFLASAGYIGYIPFASGTFGSLVGIPLFFALSGLQSSPAVLVALYAVLVLAACAIAGKADEYLQEHDSHKIVIDEVVGYLGATLFLSPTWPDAVAAFFLFRALDVIKPFPAWYIDEHGPGGFGVTLDDVVSGFYTHLILSALIWAGLFA